MRIDQSNQLAYKNGVMLLRALCLFPLVLFLSSCSEPEPQAVTEPTAPPPPPEPIAKTSGCLVMEGVPEEGVSLREAIIVEAIGASTRETLLRQRALFERKITGEAAPVTKPAVAPTLMPEDAAALQAKLVGLRQAYPQRVVAKRDVGNQRMESFQTDGELYQKYLDLFRAINLENIDRAYKALGSRISEDGKQLTKSSENFDAEEYAQAEVDVEWLNQLKAHLKDYQGLVREVEKAKQRFVQEGGSAPKSYSDWDSFMADHSVTLLSEVFSASVGAAEIAEDGCFEVEGQGELLVRIEYGVYSAYFFPSDPKENRVTVTDLRQFED